MSDTITIPRPVVPYGPHGMTEDEGTAHYLREVLEKIDTGFLNVGGSNVTAAVRSILIDCARALEGVDTAPERGEWIYGAQRPGEKFARRFGSRERAERLKDSRERVVRAWQVHASKGPWEPLPEGETDE